MGIWFMCIFTKFCNLKKYPCSFPGLYLRTYCHVSKSMWSKLTPVSLANSHIHHPVA